MSAYIIVILAVASVIGGFAVWYMVQGFGSDDTGMVPAIALRQPVKVGPGETYKIEVLAISNSRWSADMIGMGLMSQASPMSALNYRDGAVWGTDNFDLVFVDTMNDTYLNAGDYFLVTFKNMTESGSVTFQLLYKKTVYSPPGVAIVSEHILVSKTL